MRAKGIGGLASLPLIVVLHCLLAAAWRRRYLIAIPLVLMPPVGLIAGLYAPKTYEARMTVLVQDTTKLNPFLEDIAIKSTVKERMPALEALLHSRHVLEPVVRDMHLLPEKASRAEIERTVGELSGALSVRLIGSELIELRYVSRNREGMDRILATVGNRFLERVLAPESSSMTASVSFLDSQLSASRRELDAGEARLADFRSANASQLPDLHAGNVARLSQLRQLLSEQQTAFAGAEAAMAETRSRLVRTNPVVGKIEEQIVVVTGELALLRARYTDEHSQVQSALRRLSRLEHERDRMMAVARELTSGELERMWNMAASSTGRPSEDGMRPLLVTQLGELQSARAKVIGLGHEIERLRIEIADLERKVNSHGTVQLQLRELEREVTVKREIYASLLKRAEMARVTGELGRFQRPERVKVIDQPVMPSGPTRPMTLVFMLAGLAGGIALGLGMAVAAEIADTSVRRVDALHAMLDVPVLARIPVLADEAFVASGGLDPRLFAGIQSQEFAA
ncbi:chain-length determining protein [Allostella sp. ATCC 35155]|nr:chain-length determining protein [Stella sp. ATCC 35155]